MFKLFKRWGSAPPPAPAPAPEPTRARPAPSTRRALPPTEPLPVPEVVAEGNEPTDWSLWEDSVNQVDSQMQGILPSQRIYEHDTRPSQLDDVDPFASVRKKRGT